MLKYKNFHQTWTGNGSSSLQLAEAISDLNNQIENLDTRAYAVGAEELGAFDGGVLGEFRWDQNNIYVQTADDPIKFKKSRLFETAPVYPEGMTLGSTASNDIGLTVKSTLGDITIFGGRIESTRNIFYLNFNGKDLDFNNGKFSIDEAADRVRINVGLRYSPGHAVTQTPPNNGDLTIETTSNTVLTFKYKGDDGVVRSGTLALA